VQAYLDFLLAEHAATIELQWRRTLHQLNIYWALLCNLYIVLTALKTFSINFSTGILPLRDIHI
jgi:hypothetical protein